MSGVNAVSGAQGPQGAKSVSGVTTENGKIVLNFQGEKYPLTKKQAEQYNEILYNLNYTKNRIGELKAELEAKGVSAKRKAEIQAELKPLQEKYAKQQAAASFDILPAQDGGMYVAFKMKKDIKAEEFKSLYNLEDGAFRYSLKQEALEDGRGVEKTYQMDIDKPYTSYDDAMMTHGYDYPIRFSNGVALVASDDAGHYYPDYSNATLSAGSTYNVDGSYVEAPDAKPWWKFW